MEDQAIEFVQEVRGKEAAVIPTEVAAISIAISLKRIADAMQEPNEYGEIGGAAIAGAIARGLRDR